MVIAASVANLRHLILLMVGSNTPAFLLSRMTPLIRSKPTLKSKDNKIYIEYSMKSSIFRSKVKVNIHLDGENNILNIKKVSGAKFYEKRTSNVLMGKKKLTLEKRF